MNGLIYLLQLNFYLLSFYTFYRLILSKETFFGLNRGYLIGSTLLSFCIPVLQSEWLKELFAPKRIEQAASQFNIQAYEFLYVPQAEVETFSLGQLLSWVYFTVLVILLIRLTYRLIKAYRWMKNPQNSVQACSFFNYIAVDEDLEGREAIMVHEQVHVQQGHSADVLFFELNAIINWFNPIAYFLKAESRKVHEYIADAAASETLSERSDYAMLLFHENFGVKSQELTNSFFNQSILKQRIMMLQKNKSNRKALLKYGFTAPLFLGMLVLSSAFVSDRSKQTELVLNTKVVRDTIKTEKNSSAKKLKNTPLYVVDGKVIEKGEMDKIDPKNIATVNIKRASQKGKDTVEISTKTEDLTIVKKDGKQPLFIVNGKKSDINDEQLSIHGIASVNVLKDKSATDKYGDKGKDGVVEITLKNKDDSRLESKAIAGSPSLLYVVDGKVMGDNFMINSIDPKEIATVNIVKNTTLTGKYGKKGADGVVEITLKKKN